METQMAPPEARGEAESMLAFAAYLRDTPDAVLEDPVTLASQFGLPPPVVRETLDVARLTRKQPASPARTRRPLRAVDALKAISASMVQSPNLATVALGLVPTGLAMVSVAGGHPGLRALSLALWALLLPALIAINVARAQARYGVSTALIAAAMLSLPGAFADSAAGPGPALRFATSFAVTSVLIAIFTVASATIGGYLRMHREIRNEERFNRLKLLERVFDLEGKLREDRPGPAEPRASELMDLARRHWVLFAAASGVLLALTTLAIKLTAGIPDPAVVEIPSPAQFVPAMAQLMLTVGLAIGSGFAAGQWRRGLVAGTILVAAMHAMSALGLDGVGFDGMIAHYTLYPWALSFALLYVCLGALGGLGATVEARALRERRLQAADHTALLSEIVRLQQVLNTGTAEVCVLAVDCAKSTVMKNGADSLKVEASFRAFHVHIDGIVRRNGGSVLSVAGDGAVAEFVSPASALMAAKEIQARMPEFNRKSNRLMVPFLVRVGLHCGQVQGGLDQVVFNQVIDIAAHIERAAPVGGVAVTDAVRERLPDEAFAELASRVDGHAVHIALNPVG